MDLLKKKTTLVFLLIFLLAFFLRIRGLDQVGFSEDEVNKVNAARSYLQDDFSVNAEHPMLMKWLVTVSVVGADWWNRGIGHAHPILEETAVRFPNLVFGSLTAIVLFGFAQEMFGFEVGLTTAVLWAIGTPSIMVNRIAKEDTLLVFFTWLAYLFYLRAKNLGFSAPRRQEKLFGLSGASFGLMLASKYFAHHVGFNFLYYHLLGRKEKNQPIGKRGIAIVVGTLVLVFLAVNPIILFPNTLRYMKDYVFGHTITHHAYLVMGRFYYNEPSHFFLGVPFYTYLLFLAIKIQLPILASMAVGLSIVVRRRRKPGSFFLLFMLATWLIPYSFIGMKRLRYMLSLMPIVYMISAIGIVQIFSWVRNFVGATRERVWRPVMAAAVITIVFVAPAWTALKAAPFYSLYLNPLGRDRVAYYFPHEELYDAGLRETIQHICKEARPGATIAGEAPVVYRYYFHKFGRDDLQHVGLSKLAETKKDLQPTYAVVQHGREYLDNVAVISALESQSKPVSVFRVGAATAEKVYRMN